MLKVTLFSISYKSGFPFDSDSREMFKQMRLFLCLQSELGQMQMVLFSALLFVAGMEREYQLTSNRNRESVN